MVPLLKSKMNYMLLFLPMHLGNKMEVTTLDILVLQFNILNGIYTSDFKVFNSHEKWSICTFNWSIFRGELWEFVQILWGNLF